MKDDSVHRCPMCDNDTWTVVGNEASCEECGCIVHVISIEEMLEWLYTPTNAQSTDDMS